MKTIIKENHYQKRLWKEACFQHDLKSGFEKRRAESLAVVKRRYLESNTTLRTVPSLIGRMKFKLASRYAVALARHYEMNVHIKASDSLGIIELCVDEIMFDTVWKDGKLKRHFLLLFVLANGVCMQSKTENDNTFLCIWMSYDLARHFHI